MTRAVAWVWWSLTWVWWVITTWLPWAWRSVVCKLSWTRYNIEWDWDRWRGRRLHHQMWRHYQRTGTPMVTDR